MRVLAPASVIYPGRAGAPVARFAGAVIEPADVGLGAAERLVGTFEQFSRARQSHPAQQDLPRGQAARAAQMPRAMPGGCGPIPMSSRA